MLDPYRSPGPVDADLLPRTALPSGFAKALSAAATLLLFGGSASLSAMTWTVTSTLARLAPSRAEAVQTAGPQWPRAIPAPPVARHEHAPRPEPRPRPLPVAQAPAGWSGSILGSLGPDTHDVDTLWQRAEKVAADTGALTLVRATMAPAAMRRDLAMNRLVPHRGGLGVVKLGEGSLEALFGLKQGDLVTAINGYSLRSPEGALSAYASSSADHGAVVELVRAGKLVALRIDTIQVQTMR